MSEILKTLVEMGFSEARANLAVSKTSGRDVQEAMEWLLSNDEDVTNLPSTTEATGSTETPASEDANSDGPSEAKSLKCDDCGRLFKSQIEVEFHAAKSGHTSFSESTEEKKPLTEEEKKAQIEKVEQMMKQKRVEREEREKLEALEREKNRIRSGKDMLEARKKVEEQEMMKLIQQRKKEKQDEKLARQRVRDQIEQDKLARKAKFGNHTEATSPIPMSPAPSTLSKIAITRDYAEAKLQIRLTNGSALTQTFGAKEPLSVVRLYVEINRTDEPGPFALMTSFPRKLFGPDDYDKPLDMLGLTPSAVIIVTKS